MARCNLFYIFVRNDSTRSSLQGLRNRTGLQGVHNVRVILDSVLQFLDNLTAVRYRGVVLTRCAGGGVISARPGLQAHASMSRAHVHNWTRGGVTDYWND